MALTAGRLRPGRIAGTDNSAPRTGQHPEVRRLLWWRADREQ